MLKMIEFGNIESNRSMNFPIFFNLLFFSTRWMPLVEFSCLRETLDSSRRRLPDMLKT